MTRNLSLQAYQKHYASLKTAAQRHEYLRLEVPKGWWWAVKSYARGCDQVEARMK